MKKTNIRVLSFLMALLLTLQVSPMAFASDLQDVTTETVEEAPEEVIVEVVEEDSEEIPEESEEPTEEVLPEETEEEIPEETEEAKVSVSFVFEAEYALTLTQGDEVIAPETADASVVTYELAPGSYAYAAKMRGHIGTAEGTVEVTEDMEAVSIAPELEKYPFDLPGLPLNTEFTAANAEAKAAIAEHGVLESMTGLVPGEDYAADEVMIMAESEEEAQLYAEAFGAEMVSTTLIRLQGISVADALAASLNEDLLLPAVQPNFYSHLEPPAADLLGSTPENEIQYVYNSTSWRTWIDSIGASNADTYLRNPSSKNYQYSMDKMNVYKAWGIVTGSSSVRVAVLDTGVNTSHEDLKIAKTGYYSSFGTVNDGNGHGTHCAGIIGATMGNGKGIAGIASGVSLYIYKSFNDKGSGEDAATVAGIMWAINNSVDIISMSTGNKFYNYQVEKALREAVSQGITVVAAMGNEGTNLMAYPAGYNIPGLIAVGATDGSNNRAPYSNYGSWCDIMAPGTGIMSTIKGGSAAYDLMDGTSMACPNVAGACALFMSRFGHRMVAPKDMEKMVKASKTNGVLDVYKLVSKKYTPKYVGYSLMSGEMDVSQKYDASERLPQNLSILLNSEDTVIYTLDGTLPGCLNGKVANGEVYKNAIRLSDFEIGETIQLNAVAISEDGDMGEVLTLNFMVVAAEIEETEEAEVPAETTEPEETEDGEMSENVGPISNKIYVGYKSGGYEYTYKTAYNYDARLYPLVSATVYSTLSPNYQTQNAVTVEVKNNYGNAVSCVLSTSSKIVNVSGNKVTAVPGKTGTATIKVTARDGSNKTTSFKVKVVNPASRIDISTKSLSMGHGYYLAVGKSTTHKAVLGDAYGKPSSKKVEWHADLYYNGSKRSNYGYFTISSSGKLAIKKDMANLVNYSTGYSIKVYAKTTDGTNLTSNEIEYRIVPPYKAIKFQTAAGGYSSSVKTTFNLSDVTGPLHAGFVADNGFGTGLDFVGAFTVTSSNPSVASVSNTIVDGVFYTANFDVYINKRGTTTITVKANDGSGKKATFKLTVK